MTNGCKSLVRYLAPAWPVAKKNAEMTIKSTAFAVLFAGGDPPDGVPIWFK